MPLSSKVRDRCRTYLGTDERIQYVIPGATELGPLEIHPSLGPILSVGGIDMEIDEEYVSAVRAANLEIGDDALPEDPYPGG
ncbi:hypothetical protein [Amycolatopsis sp. NPDC051061]|uniref:hypothetical protein n=1 Tax=Amycolatopsis sp. NPDC051061 TaxID=3155042 RepID=UPI00344068DC